MPVILGISAFYHDSAAAIVVDGEVIAAAQEERFNRKKNTAVFPTLAITYCLAEAGYRIETLDAIVFYDKPLLKFERLLETYFAFAPRGLISFLKAIPIWINEKLFLKKLIYDGLKEIEIFDKKKLKIHFSEHHLSHAASTFFCSSFKESAILTVDGVGEWCTASISHGVSNNITCLKEMEFPHSVGLLYSAFTYYLGFKVNSGEYKLMGLSPYGNIESSETKRFIEIIKTHIVSINSDGSIWLNQDYFAYSTGLKMTKSKRWFKLFGLQPRLPDDAIQQQHCNMALAIQKVTEEIVVLMAMEAKRITKSQNLCLAGGVALNCVANGVLKQKGIFENIFIQPAAGDAGGALGAALAMHFIYFQQPRNPLSKDDNSQIAYLGPDFSSKEIQLMNKRFKANCEEWQFDESFFDRIASYLADGKVVGWFQDRMEFGPRALGNRSILGDARDSTMQQKINLKIKKREGFRPFAPVVLTEDAQFYFDLKQPSPFMLFVVPICSSIRNIKPINFGDLSWKEKIGVPLCSIPAVTHVDFSARVQTVSENENAHLYRLLISFKKQTNCSVLINTSFNVRGEPMVCSPEDAYSCFMRTDMDILVINNFIYLKENQPIENRKIFKMANFEED